MFRKIGGGIDGRGQGPLKAGNDKINYAAKAEKLFDGIVRNEKFIDEEGNLLTAGKSGKVPPGQIIGNQGNNGQSEPFRYFYHPDHLGSTSYITDATGEVYQHLEYFAFGETFVEEQGNTDKMPYKFNGKELDEETGLYYYGALYYDAQTSVWLSVDPLADKMPGWSPYSFSFNNPVKYVDLDGRDIVVRGTEGSSITITTDLIDIEVNAASFVGNIGGNYTLGGADILEAGLDIAGIFDPTGVVDGVSAAYYADKGDWGSAVISGVSILPLGDAAKLLKAKKHIKTINTAIDAVHGNSKLSKKAQHGYEIFNKETGEVLEYGISGQKRSAKQAADGGSPRINQKLRTKYNNDPNIGGRVVDDNLGNRQDALNWEQGKVNDFARKRGEGPSQQKLPKPKIID